MEEKDALIRTAILGVLVSVGAFAIVMFYKWNSAAALRPVPGRPVKVFDAPHFSGNSKVLVPGAYVYGVRFDDGDRWDIEDIKSVLIPNGQTVTLYKNDTFVGNKVFLRSSTPDVSSAMRPHFVKAKGLIANDGEARA